MFGNEHQEVLTSIVNLASVLENQGKYKEAENMHQQVLNLRMEILGEEHPSTLTSMNHLALVLKSQGKYKNAEVIRRQELELREKALGKEHPHTLTSMSNMGILLRLQDKDKESEKVTVQTPLRTVVIMSSDAVSPEHIQALLEDAVRA